MRTNIIRLSEYCLSQKSVLYNLEQTLQDTGKVIIIIPAVQSLLNAIDNTLKITSLPHIDVEQLVRVLESEIELVAKLFKLESKAVADDINELIQLIKGIHYTGSVSLALHNRTLSYADIITAKLFSQYLKVNKLQNKYISPISLNLICNEHNNTSINVEQSKQYINWDLFGEITVIPGSFGCSLSSKNIIRIDEQAADCTASALTAILNSKELQLWNMKGSFKTAPPEIIEEAVHIDTLSFSEASELAYFSSSSIHPQITAPLLGTGAVINIFELFDDCKLLRTQITEQDTILDRVVKSVAYSNDISILQINGAGVGYKAGILASVTDILHRENINIRSVITAQTCINIIFDKKEIPTVKNLFNTENQLALVYSIKIISNISLIAIIGHGMQSKLGISANLFSALSRTNTNILLSGSGASDLTSYLVVNDEDRDKSIIEIHNTFFN